MDQQVYDKVKNLYGSRLPKHYERDLCELLRLSEKINAKIADGTFYSQSYLKRVKLVRRLKSLYNGLIGPVSGSKLKYLMAFASIFVIGIGVSCELDQNPGDNPGTEETAEETTEETAEEEQAESLSVAIAEGNVTLNNGESKTFTASVTNPEADATHTYAWYVDNTVQSGETASTFAFSSAPSSRTDYVIKVVVSDGTNTAEASITATVMEPSIFAAPVTNPFGLDATGVTYWSAMDFVDIDNDGDFDAFVGEWSGTTLNFFENTGNASSPSFASPTTNPYGIAPPSTQLSPAFVDIDNDGDFDLFLSLPIYNNGGTDVFSPVFFYENTGDVSSPTFAAGVLNPFGLDAMPADGFCYVTLTALAFVDIDNDGDLDLFKDAYYFSDGTAQGTYYGLMLYYENTGNSGSPAFASPVISPKSVNNVALYPFPAFTDFDGDGDFDLFFGEFDIYYGADLHYSENIGDADNANFTTPFIDPFGANTSTNFVSIPTFADIDGDGDEDLFVGEYNSYGSDIFFFENTTN